MTLEEIETIRARSDRLSPQDLAIQLVKLWDAFAGGWEDRESEIALLMFRGMSRGEAESLVERIESLTV